MAKNGIAKEPSKDFYFEAVGIAIAKNVEERLLSPIVGNGTVGSGIVKGIGGFGIPMVFGKNKWTKIISTAFIVDSAEDFVNALWGMISGATASTSDEGW